MADGDDLHLFYGSMGELGLMLLRRDSLRLAVGVRVTLLAGLGVSIEIDPRVDDMRLYGLARALDEPGRYLAWIDPTSVDYERQVAELDRLPANVRRVSFAVRCDDGPASTLVNQRLIRSAEGSRRPWGFEYQEVGTRFCSREQLVEYLRALPTTRPDDFFLRISAGEDSGTIREGDTATIGDWLIHVRRVASDRDAFVRNEVAVSRTHPALTAERRTCAASYRRGIPGNQCARPNHEANARREAESGTGTFSAPDRCQAPRPGTVRRP